MTDKHELALSRRQLLGGLGVVGAATAGAGIGTTALFSDTESFETNSIAAGRLDLVVDYYTSRHQGQAGSDSSSGEINGNPGEYSYSVSDVKPGDSGTLAFCPKVVDNPGFVWVGSAAGVTDYENGRTEPEGQADATGGGTLGGSNDGSGAGELSDAIQVIVSYAGSVSYDESADTITCDDTRELNNPPGYTLADLAKDLESGFRLDGNEPGDGDDSVDAYPGSSGADDQQGPCLCIEWEVPTDVGNEIQSDALALGFQFAAVQERSNADPSNPFVDLTVGTGSGFDYGSIQAAVDAASPGDVISVASGTYNEEVSIGKSVTITAAQGASPLLQGPGAETSSTGLNLDANDVVLRGLGVEEYGDGLRVSNGGAVQGLCVTGCSFDDNGIGWYLANNADAVGAGGVTSTFDDIVVKHTSFNGNRRKGIYAEKLSNALFEDIEVRNSGTLDGYVVPNGIDINLKYGDYENITIRDSTIYESGIETSAASGFRSGEFYGALVLKARGTGNDSTYATPNPPGPATIDNVVVEDNTFEFDASTQSGTTTKAIQTGEPAINWPNPTPASDRLEEPTPGDDNDGDGFDDITITGNTYTNVDIQLDDLTQ